MNDYYSNRSEHLLEFSEISNVGCRPPNVVVYVLPSSVQSIYFFTDLPFLIFTYISVLLV